jgi:hypothetical protein
MDASWDLATNLTPDGFEHLVNEIALRVLGPGHTGFGPGPDGGRDGYFEGEAPYPSSEEHWSGRWYIQSKFHLPNLSDNSNTWLIEKIREEIREFQKPGTKRTWPDNWIVATNIEPSGRPETGAFDAARAAVQKARPQLRFAIWGGRKILDFLHDNSDIAEHYAHFLTPGKIYAEWFRQIKEGQAQPKTIIRHLLVTQFDNQQYTRLQEAGSTAQSRPGIHRVFTDIPFECRDPETKGMAARCLAQTAAQNHRLTEIYHRAPEWGAWSRQPMRARVWFVKGGPGQGKSTLAQYMSQIQRAALILQNDGPIVTHAQENLAKDIRTAAQGSDFWPVAPRIPVFLELKEFARWYAQPGARAGRGILRYLADRLRDPVQEEVLVGTLRGLFSGARWLLVFDALDEVPGDIKDAVATEVIKFVDDDLLGCRTDALIVCTSRPQGYSGQFAALEAAPIELSRLTAEQALACAEPVLCIDRTEDESRRHRDILKRAVQSPAVREMMTTPLQAHIMAVVVRDGGRPPERLWQLYTTFYNVIRKREADHELPNDDLRRLLQDGNKLLKNLHNRLGFVLHAQAETSKTGQISLTREEFMGLVQQVVEEIQEFDVESTVEILKRATMERLVLISTPENIDAIRFEIQPLQEFFAGEYIYQSVKSETLRQRLRLIGGDSHWREVVHFILSALVEDDRPTELSVSAEVLEHLNYREYDDDSRFLSKRLAAGAIAAARLFQEGVFEHDKAIRQRFAHCLEPLLASTDPNICRILRDVRGAQSRAWLLGVLLDSLNRLQESEHIGASIILAETLTDEDKAARNVELLRAATPAYLGCLFEVVLARQPQERRSPRWILELAWQSLLSPNWMELGPSGVSAAIAVLRSERDRLSEAAVAVGVNPRVATIFSEFIRARDAASITRPDASGLSIEFRRVAPTLRIEDWEPETWRLLSEGPGILQCLYRVLHLAKARSVAALRDLLDFVSDRIDIIASLPPQVKAYLPLDPGALGNRRAAHWRGFAEQSLSAAFSRRRIGYCTEPRIGDAGFNRSQWEQFIDLMPAEAALIFSEEKAFFSMLRGPLTQIRNVMSRFQEEEFFKGSGAAALVSRLQLDSAVLLDFPEIWGKCILRCPDLEGDFRSTLADVCKAQVTFKARFGSMYQFLLRLPAELSLLPHVFNALTTDLYQRTGVLFRLMSTLHPEERLDRQVEAFVPDPRDLEAVLTNCDLPGGVRAAAAMMFSLHPKRDKSRVPGYLKLLPSLYEPSPWFLTGAAICLEDAIARNDKAAARIMGELLRLGKDDYLGRRRLDPLLAKWRETSRAPIQTAINRASSTARRRQAAKSLAAEFTKLTAVSYAH